jgi:acyl-CoA reductase-like NAD-dependent aldehyde dehydrogenase
MMPTKIPVAMVAMTLMGGQTMILMTTDQGVEAQIIIPQILAATTIIQGAIQVVAGPAATAVARGVTHLETVTSVMLQAV